MTPTRSSVVSSASLAWAWLCNWVRFKLRQVGAGSVFGLGEESRGVLLHQAVQRCLLGAVALVVDRGAVAGRPAGLGGVVLHALGICNRDGAASQGARANASAFGGITYPHRHGNGPAALAGQRPPPAIR